MIDPTNKQLYSPGLLDFLLIIFTLLDKVWGIAIQYMSIVGINVYMLEEVVKHVPDYEVLRVNRKKNTIVCVPMVALRVVSRNPTILIHVEGLHIFEGNLETGNSV